MFRLAITSSCTLAIAIALLASCDRRDAHDREVVTIRYWAGFPGPDGRTMLRLVKRFNQENPDVHVIMQRMQWAQYYNKLFVAGLANRGPEVFVSHRSALQRFVAAGFVRPADDLIGNGENQLRADDFDPNILAAAKQGGHYWGVPLDVHPIGMYYNRMLLKQVGFVDPAGNARPPTNREEFLDLLHRLKPSPGVRPNESTWGFVYTWQRNDCYTVMSQFGGSLFDPTLTKATFTAPANVEALQWCSDLVRDGLVPNPQDLDSWVLFRQGRAAVAFQGIFMLPDLQKQIDLDWGAAPVPLLGKHPAAWADSHNLVMRKGLEGKQLEASKRLIKFLSDHSLDWAEGGQVPVRKSLRESDRFRAMYAQSEFAKQIPYVSYFPPTPFIFEYQTEFDLAVERALRGTMSAKDALAAANVNVQAAIDRYRQQGFDR